MEQILSETESNFIFENEDHTLGSLLQQELLKDNNVHYAGYIIDHPFEKKMRIEIKTYGQRPKDALTNSINNILKKLDIVKSEYIKAKENSL